MKWMNFCLNVTLTLICSIFSSFFLVGCSGNDSKVVHDWNGSEDDFLKTFKEVEGEDRNISSILADRISGAPFTGNINRVEDGRSTEQIFVEGLLHGKSVKKSEDGSWVEANYKNGQLHGSLKFYRADGTVRSEIFYEDGKRIQSVAD